MYNSLRSKLIIPVDGGEEKSVSMLTTWEPPCSHSLFRPRLCSKTPLRRLRFAYQRTTEGMGGYIWGIYGLHGPFRLQDIYTPWPSSPCLSPRTASKDSASAVRLARGSSILSSCPVSKITSRKNRSAFVSIKPWRQIKHPIKQPTRRRRPRPLCQPAAFPSARHPATLRRGQAKAPRS